MFKNNLTLLALPLGFTVVPLYMLLPRVYEPLGLSLSVIGLVLMLAHLLDALASPFLGKGLSTKYQRGLQKGAFLLLLLGFIALFLIPYLGIKTGALYVLLICVTLVSVSDSALIISLYAAHNSVELATKRETLLGFGLLLGVLSFELLSIPFYILLFCSLLCVGFKLFPSLPLSEPLAPRAPLQLNATKKKLLIFIVLNSLPTAVTSVLFFTYVEGVLGRKDLNLIFLAAFFGAAALSQPLWARVVHKIGLKQTMLFAMVFMLLIFPLAAFFPTLVGFTFVCLLSGLAMGAEVMIMPLLLTQSLAKEEGEGHALFGLLAFIGKSAFALAAGIAFPFAVFMGLEMGGESAIRAIIYSYVGLPSAIKIAALLFFILKVYRDA